MEVQYMKQPEGLGAPLGRYSHVARSPRLGLVAIAGQVGLGADGKLPGDGGLAAQVRKAFENLKVALNAGGCEPSSILKTTTYLTSADLIEEFMDARADTFADLFPDNTYPPNTLLIVSRLVEPELLVEVEALAVYAPENSV